MISYKNHLKTTKTVSDWVLNLTHTHTQFLRLVLVVLYGDVDKQPPDASELSQ